MTRRRPFIPQRKPIFIGCEGESEQAYASFLQDLIRAADIPIHLIIEVLGPGAGDPLSRVEMAVRKLAHLARTRTAPKERYVLLDSDQAEREPDRADRAERIAAENGIKIIWQVPCFEAVLLRHFENYTENRPPNTPTALRAIDRAVPGYKKPLSRSELAKRLNAASVRRVSRVEPALAEPLRKLGLI